MLSGRVAGYRVGIMVRLPRLLCALLLPTILLLSACSGGGSDSGAGTDSADAPRPAPRPTTTPVPGGLEPAFFGMHDSDAVGPSWPKAPVGSLRIWDAGVAWNQIETTPGQYDFSRLDAIVKTARAHHAQSLIVLGQTPTFHSKKPKQKAPYGLGAAAMPDLAAWTAYVRAVVTRYNAPDVAFQVWNESNVVNYWSGTPHQMALLTAAARQVVDGVTPKPTLVGPAMATRLLGQRAFIRLFYGQKVKGVPVADMVDVISLQLYAEVGEGPERSDALLAEARRILGLQGVPADKRIWDTEVNYGANAGQPVGLAPVAEQQANVAKTFVLDASAGVERTFWYSWDLHGIADTDLSEKDNTTLTPAGQAYVTVRRWLLGSKVTSCKTVEGGTWACRLQTPSGPASVYWNPDHAAIVRTAFDATSAETIGQPAQALPVGGAMLTVGDSPVLVRSDASGSSSVPPRV